MILATLLQGLDLNLLRPFALLLPQDKPLQQYPLELGDAWGIQVVQIT
jgi:hypothetical protein